MERISHYRLEARLGRGAMGEVWRAVDERLGRAVALKLLPEARAQQASLQARLLREAQAASALNHPGIVTVHDVGSWHGRTFMVMELVDGQPLSELARSGVAAPEALRLVADAAEALQAAHARDILHRDIKGDNLMRTRDGRIKVLDFGLAKLRAQPVERPARVPDVDALAAVAETLDSSSSDSGGEGTQPGDRELVRAMETAHADAFPPLGAASASTSLTNPGALVGTPVYMAPEQTDGTAGDAQSEVWSLGVVLYELLTGARPFDRATIGETLQAIRTAPIVPPSQAAPRRALPPLVDGVVLKALARERTQRYADMRAFAAALRRAARKLSPGHTTAGEAIVDELTRRWLFAPIVLVLLAGIGGFAWLLRPARTPPPTLAAPPPTVVKGARRITFAAGCEEYPSFTPDGRSIVYDGVADGDYELLALDVAAGTSTRLTHAPGWDYAGAVSPDGRSIAYVHVSDAGREVRLLPIGGDAAGAPEMLGLSPAGFPAWSRDGGVLVGDGDALVRWTRGAHGPERRVVAKLPSGSAARYTGVFANGDLVALWQPSLSSNELVVGEIPRGGRARVVEGRLPLDQVGVVVAPAQGGYYYARHQANANELVRRRFGGAAEIVAAVAPESGLSISPDGTRLAYSTCRESGVLARLRPGKPAEELLARGAWRDAWPAPADARHVAFQSDRAGGMQVWLLDLVTHDARPLAPPASSHPSVSRDGKWVAYVGGGEPGIHVAPLDGGAARRLTDDADDDEPQFAGDGRTLVFERTDADEGARVWAVDLAGGAPRPLSPVGALSPAASPTDGRVVFLQPTARGRVLMTSELDGRAATPLSSSLPAADWLNPRFSPDGKRLVVVRKTTELVEIELATGAMRVVWQAGLDGISEASYAADGDGWVAAVQVWNGDLWLADGDFR